MTFAVLTTLLLGLKAGLIALALNLATLFFWSWAVAANFSGFSYELNIQSIRWHALNLSFFFMNAVITISLGVLVSALAVPSTKGRLPNHMGYALNTLALPHISELAIIAYDAWLPF